MVEKRVDLTRPPLRENPEISRDLLTGKVELHSMYDNVFGRFEREVYEGDLDRRLRGIDAYDIIKNPERMLHIAKDFSRLSKNERVELSSTIGHDLTTPFDFFKSLKHRLNGAIRIREPNGRLRAPNMDETHPVLDEFDKAMEGMNQSLPDEKRVNLEVRAPCVANPPRVIAIGRGWWLEDEIPVDKSRLLGDDEIAGELRSLHHLREAVARRKETLYDSGLPHRLTEMLGVEYMLILDPAGGFIDKARETVKAKRYNALWALEAARDDVYDSYKKAGPEAAGMAVDARRAGNRAMMLLAGKDPDELGKEALASMNPDTVILAPSINHTMGASLAESAKVKATVVGNAVDLRRHLGTLYMERGATLAAVDNLENLPFESGDHVIVDTFSGQPCVIINPTENTKNHYRKLQEQVKAVEAQKAGEARLEAATKWVRGDFTATVQLSANTARSERADFVKTAVTNGAKGVGLYRSEEGLLHLKRLLDEDGMERFFYDDYRPMVLALSPLGYPVQIRALDLGGDKIPPCVQHLFAGRDSLAFRGASFLLENPWLLRAQSKAIMRLGAESEWVEYFIPMIQTPSQLAQVKGIIEESKDHLRGRGVAFNEKLRLGIMNETPMAVINTAALAKDCDFMSVGGNDLAQAALGLEPHMLRRGYHDHDPSVLRLIRQIIDNVPPEWRKLDPLMKRHLPLSFCGDMDATPTGAVILTGMGYRKLSMIPTSIPSIKRVIMDTDIVTMETVAKEVLELRTPDEVIAHTKKRTRELAGVDLDSERYTR
ncbi:MAG: hypothetical protein PHG85_03385 [Candidatus Altiarchaeota archaeon]|nr:hypothetical protein [Candidatus Altiarchaeota archaeon]